MDLTSDWITIDRLVATGIVGLHAWERERPQEIWIDASMRLDLRRPGETDRIDGCLDYGVVARELALHAETAERYTLEALATDLVGICLDGAGVERAIVEVSKPAADPGARRIAVRVSRAAGSMQRPACIAVGSNRDPEANLAAAVAALASIGDVVAVSKVYQTAADGTAGDAAARDYLNAAVRLETPLPAGALRRRLKAIEQSCGRDAGDAGADGITIDLDLCLLGGQVVRSGGVSVPDPDVLDRGYLALTLAEVAGDLCHPETGETLAAIAARLGGAASARVRDDVVLATTAPARPRDPGTTRSARS